jgi:hypothetical protein
MRQSVILSVSLLLTTLLAVGPANAAGDPYAADPLGLVPFIDTAQQVYSSGTDTWEVWVCEVANGDVTLDPVTVTNTVNAEITPYFQWLSEGAYTPVFVAGGVVESTDVIDQEEFEQERAFAPGCGDAVAAASDSSPNGALIVVNVGFDGGYGTFGGVCPEDPFTGCTELFPGNSRRAVVGTASVTLVDGFTEPQLITVAHEIGHAQNWAHSYTGLTFDPTTNVLDRYDNDMDMLSGESISGPPVGTLAYHRYEAGWLSPQDVRIHESGVSNYRIAMIGQPGIGMVVIPGSGPGVFYTLETRRRVSFDAGLPVAGVAVHKIDQRRDSACAIPQGFPSTWPCFATLTRITPEPAVEGGGSAHVIGLDDAVQIGLFDVSIVAADQVSFTVRVARQESGRFIDDDGNFHEPNIEAIAELGITLGCNPPDNDRYCPSAPVTRAEMAAFIIRALDEDVANAPHEGRFPDVSEDAWYSQSVERLAALGITLGYDDGTYRPNSIVTRAEMAAFLTRAFVDQADIITASGAFEDVPTTAWYANFSETLLAQGITAGCFPDPLRYCPDDQVLRDQMASFVARSLGIEP